MKVLKNMFYRFSKKNKQADTAPAVSASVLGSLKYPGAMSSFFGQRIGFQIYEQMLSDPLIYSAFIVKKYGALAVPWEILPAKSGDGATPREAKERAEFIEEALENIRGGVFSVLYSALDALAMGYSVMEIIFDERNENSEKRITIQELKPKDPALFGFEVDEFLNLTGLRLHIPGEPPKDLPIEKFIVFTHNQKYNRPTGESDLNSAYRHWAIKKQMIAQWTSHLEKFASPTVVGKFKRGLPEMNQLQLLDALEKISRQSAVIHPDDVEVALLDARKEAQSGYAEAIDYHNREIARAILGQTLTTEDSRRIGSLALGKVHLQVLIMQLAGLRRNLADKVMNEGIIRRLIDLNFGGGIYPKFRFIEPDLDIFRTGKVV